MKRQHDQPGMELGLVLRGILLVLIAAWLSGCSGSDRDPAVVLPFPPGDTGVPPGDDGPPGDDEPIVGTAFECPAEDGSAVDALAACGGMGVICVGYFDGTSVGNLAPLTTGASPAWSPDGLRIAFTRFRSGLWDATTEIHLINADGSGEQLLTAGHDPSWSPDGKRIVFTGAEGITVINADGTGRTTLLRHDDLVVGFEFEDVVFQPDWSPDGQRIALIHYHWLWRSAGIVLMNADGSDPRYVSSGSSARFPVWSPTGGEIAWHTGAGDSFFADQGGSIRIWTGSDESTLLVNQIAQISRSAWFPDGSTLAYTGSPHCGPRPAIRIVDRQGESTRTLVRHAHTPTWSPDGARLAFVTGSFFSLLPPEFPPVPAHAEVYVREHPHSSGLLSRYVLYSDGSFELHYRSGFLRILLYRGRYTREGPELSFDFATQSVAGPWQATGTLDGERLTIQYNQIMMWSDFEDGVYALSGG
jgi:dipeptidyl aminopeptidase/acylaminoacyl peptidase